MLQGNNFVQIRQGTHERMNRKPHLGQVHSTACAPNLNIGQVYTTAGAIVVHLRQIQNFKCDYPAFRVGSYRRECNKTTFSWSHKITHTQNEFQAEFTLQHVHISTFRLCSHCVRLLRINQLPQEQYSSIFMEFEQHQRWK